MLDQKIVDMKDEIIQGVAESVRIKSVKSEKKEGMPFGEGVNQALEHALDLSKKLGFKVKNIDNMVGYAEFGEGEEMVAVLGHLDVVPEGDGWTHLPYDAKIHEGNLYGRGTLDNKGPIIGALFALKAIKDLELPLKRRVRIIFGTNEESGSKGVQHYNKTEEAPVAGFTPDAEYPIINAEKGIVTCTFKKHLSTRNENESVSIVSMTGGTVPNVVPEYAEAIIYSSKHDKLYFMEKAKGLSKKGMCSIEIEDLHEDNQWKIKVYGVSAHGSTPENGKNAISGLIHFLSELNLSVELIEFVRFINEKISHETDGKRLGINLQDDVSGKLTFNLGTIKGNSEEISVGVNIRYPVTKKYNDFMLRLTDEMLSVGLKADNIKHKEPLFMDPNTELIKKLQKVYKEKTGNEPKLLAIGGGTYAKSMDNIVAFGPIFPGEPNVIHQPDEHITVDNLIKNTQIMAAAIYELGN